MTDNHRRSSDVDPAEAARAAQQAVEVARTEQIEAALRPIHERLDQQDEAAAKRQIEVDAKIDKLATSDDIKEIKEFMKGVDLTFTVIRTSGKWGKTIILTVATIFVALTVITGGFKTIVGAIASWALTK